ncbi:hypothetical protein BDN67DRAFT_570185 [Paxillus ammoniavirescens]|nr:hypothetical protein BDN67DRAFT_570185 [Paxillus ammoniavirescens]
MLINPSAILNSTAELNLNSEKIARAEPSPATHNLPLLLLSTLLAPEPYQAVAEPLPSSRISALDPDSGIPVFPSSTIPSSGAGNDYTLSPILLAIENSPSTSPIPSSSDLAGSSITGTTMGTSLPLFPSNSLTSSSDVSASPSSGPSSASGTAISDTGSLTSVPVTLSPTSSTVSLSAGSHSTISMSTFTFIPTSVLPFTTASTTDSFSSPTLTSTSLSSSPAASSSPTGARTSSTPTTTSPTSSTSSRTTSQVGPETTTLFVLTTALTTVTLPSSSRSTSTRTINSVIPGQGATTTYLVTASGSLSTEGVGSAVGGNISQSPGTIAAIVLGVIGAFAFSILWLFCARRRHRKLAREAEPIVPEHYGPGPLDDEVLDGEEPGYGVGSIYGTTSAPSQGGLDVEERYAGILAALHVGQGFGDDNERGSTGGVYGSQGDGATDVDGDMEDHLALIGSSTLPLHTSSLDDQPYAFPLSPPPLVSTTPHPRSTRPVLPPSAYYSTSRRRSSPGPDASAWFSGQSIAPSCNSHYAHSQTLGSGSGSGSVDHLTRTRTGSEEPLLGIGKVPDVPPVALAAGGPGNNTAATGGNRPGLGSAFGSAEGSMYSPSAIYPALQGDTSGSYDARSASGSGSYGYTRSGTPSSFDVLRSVSSHGALSSTYNHGQGQNQGFRFGFGGTGSSSSGSTGKKRGKYRHSFGNPPTSFRAWKERASGGSDKEKDTTGKGEKDWRKSTGSSTSASASAAGSMDEKQGRASPSIGVRAFLGRLRRGGHTPSPHSSNRDLPSHPSPRPSADVDPEKAAGIMGGDRGTPLPPIRIQAATPQRPQYSFVLSNPDLHPPSPYYATGDTMPSSDAPSRSVGVHNPHGAPIYTPSPGVGGLYPQSALPPGYVFAGSAPSPAPTEESRHAEGLLHPRLQVPGCSDPSLRDFNDYSRPIGGVVNNRVYSTTTFGTLDDTETETMQGTPVQDTRNSVAELADVFDSTMGVAHESWFVDDDIRNTSGNSPTAA